MRNVFLLTLLCSSLALFVSASASAQTHGKLKGYTLTRPARDANGKVLDPATASAFDPTTADTSCLTAPNDVPLTLFMQSPIFQSARFKFGRTPVGDTQYLDAFQRGNFWQLVANTAYHTLVNPVLFKPITVNIADASDGLSLPPSALGATGCGPLGILTMSGLTSLITGTLLPQLAAQGVDSSQFPIFLLYNVVTSPTKATDLNPCCILGFHQSTGTPVQTYSPIDFDTTGLFGPSVNVLRTRIRAVHL